VNVRMQGLYPSIQTFPGNPVSFLQRVYRNSGLAQGTFRCLRVAYIVTPSRSSPVAPKIEKGQVLSEDAEEARSQRKRQRLAGEGALTTTGRSVCSSTWIRSRRPSNGVVRTDLDPPLGEDRTLVDVIG